jgi:hypothetical protein
LFRNEYTPRGLPFPNYVRPKEQPRLIRVVRAAAQLDVLNRRRPAHGMGLHVVKFQERALATTPFGPDERAASTITSSHGAPHRRRDVARAFGGALRGRSGTLSLGEALAFESIDQKRDGAIEDLGRIPRRHRVTQQRLGTPELVVCLARDGELNPIALRGERCD